jgi:hypothetical protein
LGVGIANKKFDPETNPYNVALALHSIAISTFGSTCNKALKNFYYTGVGLTILQWKSWRAQYGN